MGEYSNYGMTVERSAAASRMRRWAHVRLFLGGMQMGGALTSFGFICQGGITVGTLWAVAGTGVVTLVSVALFQWPDYAKKWMVK